MTKERILLEAQRDANRSGETLAVLNLNTIGAALYVIRAYRPEYEAGKYAHQFVCKVHPSEVQRKIDDWKKEPLINLGKAKL